MPTTAQATGVAVNKTGNVGTPGAFTNRANFVADPNTFNGMDVENGLRLLAINKKLEMESLLDDIFEDLGSNVVSSGDEVAVPNAIFMKLEAVPTGARQVTIPLLMALSGAPTVGPGTPLGSEYGQNLKYATFYYQEYSYAVSSTSWGKTYNDMSVYGVFEKIQPQISTYMKEFRGQRIREALLTTHDSVLTTATIGSPVRDKKWNKNWFIANTEISDQPKHKAAGIGGDAFTSEIITKLNAAATGTSGVDANITLNYLLSLEYYAKNVLRIDPIMVGGKDTYVVLIPSAQVNILKRANPGQLGEIYTEMVRKNEDMMEYTGAIGRVGSLLLIEDQRYPTLQVTGATTMVAGFLKPGNVDGRKKETYADTAKNWNVGFLLGKAAICEWTVKELHFETETQNYGYNKGTGAFGESGISIVEYDVDTPVFYDTTATPATESSRENSGSIVLAWTSPKITA